MKNENRSPGNPDINQNINGGKLCWIFVGDTFIHKEEGTRLHLSGQAGNGNFLFLGSTFISGLGYRLADITFNAGFDIY